MNRNAEELFEPMGDLEVIKQRVVVPVVSSLLKREELLGIDLWRGAPSPEWDFGAAMMGKPGDIWVRVTAITETWVGSLWAAGPVNRHGEELSHVADQLANRLEDWVCETSFAWGEERRADYDIPGSA
jgi:hypothetical protein